MRVGSELTLSGVGDCSRFSDLKLLCFSRCTLPGLAWLYIDLKHAVFEQVLFLKAII